MGKAKDSNLNRRKMMLVTGGAVAGASALVAAPFRESIKSVGRRLTVNSTAAGFKSLANGTYEQWLNEVGAKFTLGGTSRITLVGVRALPTSGAKPQGVRAQGFAAFFEPPAGQSIAPDLIYTATHTSYGPMPLFLARSSDPATPRRMVAVFN